MKANTTRFGEIEVPENNIICFKSGLLGFPGLTRYVVLDTNPNSPFKWLQSLDLSELAFVVMNPLLVKPDYKVALQPYDVAELGIEENRQLLLLVMVTVANGDPPQMTANLRGPLLINLQNNRGKQLVLADEDYTTRHSLMSAPAGSCPAASP